MMKDYFLFLCLLFCALPSFAEDVSSKELLSWMRSIVHPVTALPSSFQLTDPVKVYRQAGGRSSVGAVMERMMLRDGVSVYDAAVWQIALTSTQIAADLEKARAPVRVYWEGRLGVVANIRAGASTFVYDPAQPQAVSSSVIAQGQRGFVFRLLDRRGLYYSDDPLDGKTSLRGFPNDENIHWEDWRPIAGENAWVVLAALHVYEASGRKDLEALALAREIARAAIYLQAENGGIRMGPLGTYCYIGESANRKTTKKIMGRSWATHDTIFYHVISTENNISWYAALRMLAAVAPDPVYDRALAGLGRYFRSVWNQAGYLEMGMHYSGRRWIKDNKAFATDVQTWGIAAIGPERLDSWFGEGAAWQMWQTTRKRAGSFSPGKALLGVGYSDEHDRVSIEWTAGAILATRALARHYQYFQADWAAQTRQDTDSMRRGIEAYRLKMPDGGAAYAYSSVRGWIPFGWSSLDPSVASLASTGWVYLIDQGVDPFILPTVVKTGAD